MIEYLIDPWPPAFRNAGPARLFSRARSSHPWVDIGAVEALDPDTTLRRMADALSPFPASGCARLEGSVYVLRTKTKTGGVSYTFFGRICEEC